MDSGLDWLCPICKLSDFGGDVTKYFEKLYYIFNEDFIKNKIYFCNKKIIFDSANIYNGKPEIFWHITSGDDETGARNPDIRRCERIGWIRKIIENYEKPEVLVWETVRRRDVRTLLFLEQENYLVVLSNKKNVFLLITAIFIDRPHRKSELLEEYNNFCKKQQKPPHC